jgi:hypothetical protein
LSIKAIATFVLFNTRLTLGPLTNITKVNYIPAYNDDDDMKGYIDDKYTDYENS